MTTPPVDPPHKRPLVPSAGHKQMAALRAAREQGAIDLLEELAPAMIESHRRRQELQMQVEELASRSASDGDARSIAEITPLLKASWDQDAKLMDRFLGTAVQRSKAEVQVAATVTHVNLRELVEARRTPPIEGTVES